MGFVEASKSFFARYVDFQGRSSRSEYWWPLVMILVVYLVGFALAAVLPILGILILIFVLAIIIPSLAVTIRRLHDLDKSGWWIFIQLVPIIGPLLLLYWFCLKGTDGDNQFGPDPLGNVADRFD